MANVTHQRKRANPCTDDGLYITTGLGSGINADGRSTTNVIVSRGPGEAIPPRPEPSPPAPPRLPLADWLHGQAAYYRQDAETCGLDSSELIAGAIAAVARSADFHRSTSAAELVAGSPMFRRCDLDAPIVTSDRPHSMLADAIDCEVAGYLLPDQGDAARLLAWVLCRLADECDFYHAATMEEYIDSRAAFEAAAIDAMYTTAD